MVTMDEAKTELQNAISAIDSYIDVILSDIIKYRLNRVNASKTILNWLRTKFLDNWTLSYSQKTIHRKKVAVAKGSITSAEAIPPELKFNYNAEVGGYTTLQHEEGTIDVPQVDVFVFEPPSYDDFLHSFSKQVFEDVLLARFALGVNISEAPDYENAFGKYYRLRFDGEVVEENSMTLYDGKAIVFAGVTLILHTFYWKVRQVFRRYLTIDDTQQLFQCWIARGKYEVEVHAPTGTTYPSTVDAVWLSFETDYAGDVTWYAAGREFAKGVLSNSMYVKDVLIVIWNGTPEVFELN